MDQLERQKLVQHAQDVQRFREERQKLEINAAGAPADTRAKDFVPGRAKLPGSPIVGRSVDQLGKDQALPKVYNAPKPDLTVEPKSRVNLSAGQPQQHTVNRMPLDAKQLQPNVQQQQKVERSVSPTQIKQAAPQTQGNPATGQQSGGQNKDKSNDNKGNDKGKGK